MQDNPSNYFTPSPLTNKIGCYGCLIYIILFFISGWFVSAVMGWATMWVIPFMAFFVLIWFAILVWSIQKQKKDKKTKDEK
ncbi:MAG: hypothetical protein EAZ85_03260 [Bacteroidetes bacterium]|nr:MAG: hypothetical protein EAZ85_03260 [Bacteroidota bacterium]TAG86883.1 MAG: hypothetical protein EAZ20_11900 [Bacteroidota bacterium]